MQNQVYNWFFQQGSMVMEKSANCIVLQLNTEGNAFCLLTNSDCEEIIDILTTLASQIWEDPGYVRKPYVQQLFRHEGNTYWWQLNESILKVWPSDSDESIAISCEGNSQMQVEVKQVVELIQVLGHLNRGRD